ncbi:hypothetical protein AB0C12_37170 [Actinoplanes sp. NPDC048967]|uniref:hypothetical protein n=1 Tax=Actinoplanes sp. NPDC048967 TaxID=3155269 RepID=UPI0033FFB14F
MVQKILRGVVGSVVAAVVAVVSVPAASATPGQELTVGMVTGSAAPYVDTSRGPAQRGAGVTQKTLELAWDAYQPANGQWSATYAAAKRAELATYRAQGFAVVADPGIHYTPKWVFGLGQHTRFVDQYGNAYASQEPGKDVPDVVFDPAVRAALGTYLKKVVEDLGAGSLAGIRVGGGWYGELHYPISGANSLWGYSGNALKSNPVPGWIPNPVVNGTFEAGTAGWTFAAGDKVAHALQKTSSVTSQNVRVVAGRQYTLTARVKSANRVAPCVRIAGTTGTCAKISAAGVWTTVRSTFVARSATQTVQLLGAAPGTFWYDDVTITSGTSAADFTHGKARAFWNWYRNALTGYQNWQITTYRAAGFRGMLYVLYPSYGVRTRAKTDQAAEAISFDLSATSTASLGQDISQGTDWAAQVAAYPAGDVSITPYTTWIDGPTAYPGDDEGGWSPARELSAIARANGRPVAGENTAGADSATVRAAFAAAAGYGYSAVFWFNEEKFAS